MVRTVRPSIVVRRGSGSSDLVAREVAGELGQQLGHGGRTGVSDELERRDELVGLDPARRAVDPPPSLVALEDARQDRVEEPLLVGGVEPGTGKLDRRLNELGPRNAPEPAVRLLEPRHEPGYRHGARRRRGRSASTRRRSRSRSPPSRRAAATVPRRSSRAPSPRRRTRRAGSRRPSGRSGAPRPRPPKTRLRCRRRSHCRRPRARSHLPRR